MRVKAPGGGAPPIDGTTPATGPTAADGVAAPQGTEGVAPTRAAEGTTSSDPVADVARRLRSGDLTAREAVELLIDDAVARQVGRATADREALARELKDLLRRYTETDPYLASKVRRLSGNSKR
jgi:hypothetical protein